MSVRRKTPCLVVIPKGVVSTVPGRQVDFEAVWTELIEPTLSVMGAETFRVPPGEGHCGPNPFDLVTAEWVLADVTAGDPGVAYQLGVRHGVAQRGALVMCGVEDGSDPLPAWIHAYDMGLFVEGINRDEAWREKCQAESSRLRGYLDAAIEDRPLSRSPIYGALPGLKENDWHSVTSADATVLGSLPEGWMELRERARLSGRVGDLLLLAAEAPTVYHRTEFRWSAAQTATDLERDDIAALVLEDMVGEAPEDPRARALSSLVYTRLGRLRDADRLNADKDVRRSACLAQSLLERWALRFGSEKSLAAKQRTAVQNAALALEALWRFQELFSESVEDFSHGVTVIGIHTLLKHLARATGKKIEGLPEIDVDALVPVLTWLANQSLERGRSKLDAEGITKASAALGEIGIIEGDPQLSEASFRDGAAGPGVAWYVVDACLRRLRLYEDLGFRPEECYVSISTLQEIRRHLGVPVGVRGRVVVVRSQPIGTDEASSEGMPAGKEPGLRRVLARLFDQRSIGVGSIVLCQGTRGGDLIAAELALERGATVELLLPQERSAFLESDVGTSWEARFRDVAQRASVSIHQDFLGVVPPHRRDVRHDRWMLETARGITLADEIDCLAIGEDQDELGAFVRVARSLGLRVEQVSAERVTRVK